MIFKSESILRAWRWGAGLVLGTAAACVLAASPVKAAGPVAFTQDGTFRGVATGTMNEFLGIRYAQSPAGAF
ncbi:MAG TPA: hypothetical protein VGP50_03630, partial [Stellaceae bacterium]|nr:hypothetical protein [Stellaceae bacterium]